jgi:cysteinyl-tRNA synthetase
MKPIINLVFFQGHLKLPNGGKMSKSLKNFITIKEFLQHHSADQFRMLCLISNYRNGNENLLLFFIFFIKNCNMLKRILF